MGLYIEKKLVGVATFLMQTNKLFLETKQYQLRGMAILEAYQGLKYGEQILKYAEQFLKEKKVKLIWCNAREIAVRFYKRNNYKIIGSAFEIEKVGTHYVMYKEI
ncbi:GNAT family N-acetyltransferase [Ichthyenterobacterium magnum]|uniref:GNAT family N-acetyltransferase n=1 Tax=Ichthyenterobacterium magnum TaxID=1230530 RepID=UPI0037440A94